MTALTLVQPSGELWKKIREELNEDLNTSEQNLAAIKDWLRKQPHLPDEWDDVCIMSFLRGCSYSLEKCKRKLDMYFTMRTACPEFFSNRNVTRPELKSLFSKGQGNTLPGLTKEGRRVTICRAFDKKFDMEDLTNALKIAMMYGDVRLNEELKGVSGDVYVLDAGVITPSHIAILSPSIVKKFLICVQEAYPVKLKEVHVINSSPLVDIVFSIVKPFLKEKMRKRVFFHSDASALLDYIPKEILPSDFGGDGESMEVLHNAWYKKLEEYIPWFEAQEHVKANEALRPGKPTNYDELFGIDGSFKKLSID